MVLVSERVQRVERDLRDAALERERATRRRAEANRDRGDEEGARFHHDLADDQREAAERAELRRLGDVEIEGERLGEPVEKSV